jgi:hypothetical protein
MSAPTLDQLKHGDGIRVAFGSRNSQIAMVFDRTPQGNVRVYKWAARSKQWKGPLRITEGEIIGRTRAYETQALPPLPARYYGLKD